MNPHRLLAALGLLAMTAAPALGQERVELFGYFESQFMGASIGGDFIQLFSNKLRVDLRSELSDNITFAANFDYIDYQGKTDWDILQFLPDSITANVPEQLRGFYRLAFEDRCFLDNAYLKLTLGAFDLTVGRQQISPGTGYAWNPTDLFNTKDLLDPTYEQPGHNALRLDAVLGRGLSLTALYSPGEHWKDSDRMMEMKGRLGHFDITLTAVEKTWRYHDYTRFDAAALNFTERPQRRRLLGGGTAGELLGLGIWAEYGYNWMSGGENFYELLAGADYTFDFQTYVMLEVYRNTQGRPDSIGVTLNDWMRYLAAEQRSITRDQMFLFVRHPLSDLVQGGVSLISSLSDGSLALVPTLTAGAWENVEITAYLNIYLGKEGTAYASDLGSGGMLRARVYF